MDRSIFKSLFSLTPPASSGDPNKQGFDLFFGYNCQSHAHNFYPTYLWRNDQRVTLSNRAFSAHQKLPTDADPNDPASYRQYIGADYAPDRLKAALPTCARHATQVASGAASAPRF